MQQREQAPVAEHALHCADVCAELNPHPRCLCGSYLSLSRERERLRSLSRSRLRSSRPSSRSPIAELCGSLAAVHYIVHTHLWREASTSSFSCGAIYNPSKPFCLTRTGPPHPYGPYKPRGASLIEGPLPQQAIAIAFARSLLAWRETKCKQLHCEESQATFVQATVQAIVQAIVPAPLICVDASDRLCQQHRAHNAGTPTANALVRVSLLCVATRTWPIRCWQVTVPTVLPAQLRGAAA